MKFISTVGQTSSMYAISLASSFTDGKCVLFFGSRSKHKDYFFEDEWLPLENDGRLTLITAFSRDQVLWKNFYRQSLVSEGNLHCRSFYVRHNDKLCIKRHEQSIFPLDLLVLYVYFLLLGKQDLCAASFKRKQRNDMGSD